MAKYVGTSVHSIHSKNLGKTLFLSFLGIVCIILLFINIYISFYDIDIELKQVSFADLFTELSQIEAIDTDVIKLAFTDGITEDWGVFEFFKNFLNGLWSIIGVIAYVCTSIVNACMFLFQVLRVLFVGVLG